jgi:hypothetical protein
MLEKQHQSKGSHRHHAALNLTSQPGFPVLNERRERCENQDEGKDPAVFGMDIAPY